MSDQSRYQPQNDSNYTQLPPQYNEQPNQGGSQFNQQYGPNYGQPQNPYQYQQSYQQPTYQQHPYQQPYQQPMSQYAPYQQPMYQPAYQPAYEPKKSESGWGIAGLICSVLSILGVSVYGLGVLLWPLGLIFSIIGMRSKPRGCAIAGLIISIVDALLVVVGIIVALAFFGSIFGLLGAFI